MKGTPLTLIQFVHVEAATIQDERNCHTCEKQQTLLPLFY